MEKELITKIQNGDTKLFSKLVEQYKNLVYSLVLRTISNKNDAEEVAQDVFLKAFKSIKSFKGDSKFSTWLYKIAYYTSINYLREKKMLSSSIDLLEIESDDDDSLEQLNQTDQQRYINLALDYLRPIDRSLITLFYLEELEISEIEQITNLSKSNIKVKLMRIRKQLNGILTQLLKGELQTILN